MNNNLTEYFALRNSKEFVPIVRPDQVIKPLTVIQKFSDAEFRVKAFSEFCDRAVERYTNLMNMISALPDYIDGDGDDLVSPETAVQRALSDFGVYGEAVCPLSEGYHSTYQVALYIAESVYDEMNVDSLPTKGFGDPRELPSFSLSGLTSSPVLTTPGAVVDSIKTNLHSIVATQAACRAFVNKTSNGVDFLVSFENTLKDVFTDPAADLSSTANYLKNTLISITDPDQFLSTIISASGIEDEADSDNEQYNPSMSEMAKYTGSSPSCALDFSSATNAIVSTAKVAAKAVKGFLKGIFNIGKKIFSKIVEEVREVTVDPDDLKVIDKDGFSTVDGFYIHVKDDGPEYAEPDTWHFHLENPYWVNSEAIPSFKAITDICNRKANKWFAFKTLFSEIMIRWKEDAVQGLLKEDAVNCDVAYFPAKIELLIKPRVLNVSVLESAAKAEWKSDGGSGVVWDYLKGDYVEAFLDNLQLAGGTLYDVADKTERERFLGTVYAVALTLDLIESSNKQLTRGDAYPIIFPSQAALSRIPEQITNKDWINLFSGWNQQTQTYEGLKGIPLRTYLGVTTNVWTLFGDFVSLIAWSLTYEELSGDTSGPLFVPYSNNHTSWNPPSYRIATDAENKEAFNTFFTTAITIIVAVAIAGTAIFLTKRRARNLFWKRQQRVLSTNAKLASGQPLTRSEKRKYMKAQRKLSVGNSISKGLTSGTSSSAESTTVDSMQFADVLQVLTGKEFQE